MKIAIIGAMQEEIEPLLKELGEVKEIEYAKNKYYLANTHGHDLVIAYSKIGKVFASITAMTMIEHFGCEKVLFSGVAGGINPKLKIGDLIVATKLCQHDLDITAFGHPFGYVPEGSVFYETDKELQNIALEVAKDMDIELMSGVIATGDQFVANEERKNWIVNEFKADALEMEGVAVANVCNSMDIPSFVIRAISDTADMDAGFDFDKFLKTSAIQSAKFIIEMIKKI